MIDATSYPNSSNPAQQNNPKIICPDCGNDNPSDFEFFDEDENDKIIMCLNSRCFKLILISK